MAKLNASPIANAIPILLLFCYLPGIFSKHLAIPKAPAGMTYLGSFNRGSADASASSQAAFYFLSQNSAGWNTAKEDCVATLGPDAHLVYIETEPELQELQTFVQGADETGSLYWTGGKYNPSLSIYQWDNGVAFGSWLPWDNGQPSLADSNARVSLRNSGSLRFRTNYFTESLPYICELPSV